MIKSYPSNKLEKVMQRPNCSPEIVCRNSGAVQFDCTAPPFL